MEHPIFAVVGHPNKGKSSIVSTLARTDQPEIAAESGTTLRSCHYQAKVDGQVVLGLVDTPGFQRPRAAVEWLADRRREQPDAGEAQLLGQFIEAHDGESRFEAECQIIEPLMAGAAALYVVDGSRPHGSEYDAEIELLRMTGRPVMAVINPIDGAAFQNQWRDALERQLNARAEVFNPMQAQFPQCIALLKRFADLREQWRDPINRAIEALQAQRADDHRQATKAIAVMAANVLSHHESRTLGEASADEYRDDLRKRFEDLIRKLERKAREDVEHTYHHNRLGREETSIGVLDDDLFSGEVFKALGLTRWQLAQAGAVSGALIGGVVDANLGGASLLAGAAAGAAIGGAAAWFSAGQLAKVRIMHTPIAGRQLVFGPIRNVNFAVVLLNRALTHQQLVAGRPHAVRTKLVVDEHGGSANVEAGAGQRPLDALSSSDMKRLLRCVKRLMKSRDDETIAELTDLLLPQAEAVDQPDAARTR